MAQLRVRWNQEDVHEVRKVSGGAVFLGRVSISLLNLAVVSRSECRDGFRGRGGVYFGISWGGHFITVCITLGTAVDEKGQVADRVKRYPGPCSTTSTCSRKPACAVAASILHMFAKFQITC